MRRWATFEGRIDTYQCTPKAMCAALAFTTDRFARIYRHHGIRPLPTGTGAPWPNRAEAVVRLFKLYLSDVLVDVGKHPELKEVTPRSLFRKAAMARHMAATDGGRFPVELVFGRRQRDVISVG